MSGPWPLVSLGDVTKAVERKETPAPGTTYRQIGVRLWGQGAYERDSIDGAETQYQTLCRVEEGDIVVNKIWARNGSVAVVSRGLAGCYGSGEFPTFSPDPARLDSRWMHWLTKTRAFWEACDKKSQGTSGKNRIRPEAFLQIQIPLPPLTEQRRIVARVEALAERIAEAKRLREESVTEMEAVAKAEQRRLFARHEPGGFVHLESICSAIIDTIHSDPYYTEDGIPCVRSPDVKGGRLDLNQALKTGEQEYLRRTVRGEPQPGDIVFVRQGGGTGRAAIAEQGQRFSLGQALMILRPDRTKIDPRFLLHQLLSPAVREDQLRQCFIGTASPRVNIGALRRFRLVLPSLADQECIVSCLDALQTRVDSLRALQSETATELHALLPAILDKAFKGEL